MKRHSLYSARKIPIFEPKSDGAKRVPRWMFMHSIFGRPERDFVSTWVQERGEDDVLPALGVGTPLSPIRGFPHIGFISISMLPTFHINPLKYHAYIEIFFPNENKFGAIGNRTGCSGSPRTRLLPLRQLALTKMYFHLSVSP